MNNLEKNYRETVVAKLQEKFGYTNKLAVPSIRKVVVNVGLNASVKEKEYAEIVRGTLKTITGQKPVETKSKKSISNFKIRIGQVIGMQVTLRGQRMWDFLEKLLKITFARLRDFRGISDKGFDAQGNFSIGFKEFVSFPEIKTDEVEKLHGIGVVISTTAKNKEEGKALLVELGFPFSNEEIK